jgi:hypothetical protein
MSKYPKKYLRIEFVIGNNLMDGYVAKIHPDSMITVINSDGGWCVNSEDVKNIAFDVPVRCPYLPANVRKIENKS